MLIISEFSPIKFEFCTISCADPLVIKVNNITVGAIVDNKGNYLAFSVRKLVREFKNITDSCTSETIQALIVITHNTDITVFTSKHKDNPFLNVVCILIFVNHKILYLFLQLRKNCRIIC